MTERDILRTKDLALIKIDQLPTSAASYRGWRNSFLTKCCSIDLTGEDVILQWIQKARITSCRLEASQIRDWLDISKLH